MKTGKQTERAEPEDAGRPTLPARPAARAEPETVAAIGDDPGLSSAATVPPLRPAGGGPRSLSDGGVCSTAAELPGRYQPVDPITGRPVATEEQAELAQGGMGRIVCVFDHCAGREVALKERLGAESGEGSSPLTPATMVAGDARFLHEAKLTAQLEHPHIATVYEVGQRLSGRLYYTMKRVRGKTLAACLATCEDLSERLEYLPHYLNVCNAVAFAHQRGVIHRDIKAENIMVGAFGETVLLDWGLAKLISEGEQAEGKTPEVLQDLHRVKIDRAKSLDGQLIGTPLYLSPEQALGRLDLVDSRSDVYGLGVLLYEILAGRRPFDGGPTHRILHQVVAEEPSPVRGIEKRAPRELVDICTTAMNKDRDWRYAHAGQLARAVETFLQGRYVPPPGGSVRAWLRFLWRERRVHLVWLCILVLTVAAAVAAGLWRETVHREGRQRWQERELARNHELARTMQSRDALTTRLLGLETDAHRGTPKGLALAAAALALQDEAPERARYFSEVGARPYGQASMGYTTAAMCMPVRRAPRVDPALPVCLVSTEAHARLWSLDSQRGGVIAPAELDLQPTAAVQLATYLLVGDQRGQIHHVSFDGSVRFTLRLQEGNRVSGIEVSDPREILVAMESGELFLLDREARSVRRRLTSLAARKVRQVTALAGVRGSSTWLVATPRELVSVDVDRDRVRPVASLCGGAEPGAIALHALEAGGVEVAHTCTGADLHLGRLERGGYRELAQRVMSGPGRVTYLAIAARGDGLYFGTARGEIGLWTAVPTGRVQWLTGHQAAVTGLLVLDDGVLTMGADGEAREWRDLSTAVRARVPVRPVAGAVPVAIDDRARVLLRSADRLTLGYLETTEFAPDAATTAMATEVRFASDGHVVYLAPAGQQNGLYRWSPFPGQARGERCSAAVGSTLHMLDRSGQPLLAVVDGGGFQLVDYARCALIGARRQWRQARLTRVVADAHNVQLGLLYDDGWVQIGSAKQGQSSWTRDSGGVVEIAPTGDGRRLVLLDTSGRMSTVDFARPDHQIGPCDGEGLAARDSMGAVTCLGAPRPVALRLMRPHGKERLLLADREQLGLYDLKEGRYAVRVPVPRIAEALVSARGNSLLVKLEDGGWESWPLEEAFSPLTPAILRRTQRATGYLVEGTEPRPLRPEEWIQPMGR